MKIQTRSELVKLLEHFNLPKIICEVGVAEGNFTQALLACKPEKIYLIDAWQHLEQFGDGRMPQEWHDKNLQTVKDRIKGHEKKVVILKGLSSEMVNSIPDNSLGLVYLDGDHSYEGCLADLKAFLPKLVTGGIMAGHDYLSPDYGVEKAVAEFCNGKFEVNTIPEEDIYNAGFWFVKK